MAVHLPEELLSEILNRLPPKSLLRFTSVCKSWYSIITSSRFINTHLRFANSVEKQVFLYSFGIRNQFSVHRDNETFNKLTDFSLPFYKFSIVSSCNGLICIHADHYEPGESVYLWNPSIRRLFQIPHPTVTKKWATVGLGFISSTKDYKIVNICNYGPGDIQNGAEVYELSTGSWKKINNSNYFLSKNDVADYSLQCFFNNTIHWPAGRFHLDSIATFDVRKDEFGVLKVPPNIFRRLARQVFCFRDSLALVQVFKEQRDSKCCIWVMNEYGVYDSWTKHFTIDLKFGYFNPPLVFRENGEVLLTGYPWPLYELVSYDPKNKKFKDLGIKSGSFVDADYLLQSLVLLDNQSSVAI